PATPKGKRHGYVCSHCTLTADDGVSQVWLSRPWRDYGQTVFLHCDMGAHIRPEGWHNWNKPHREKTAFYAEYGNTGPGSDTSARAFGKRLKNDKGYTMAEILGGTDNWNPLEVAYTPVAVTYP
ncbi:MAG: pectin esterase, partial [Muribaculaceae bacterium]|nr:pectin esterase [Muribaculaceae bacterium]